MNVNGVGEQVGVDIPYAFQDHATRKSSTYTKALLIQNFKSAPMGRLYL
jgi:hypothetical protein